MQSIYELKKVKNVVRCKYTFTQSKHDTFYIVQ